MIHDRGLIKWLPFKSLPEQEDSLKKLAEKQQDVEKPVLSPDQKEEMDYAIQGLEKGEGISVTYFDSSRIKKAITRFINIDMIGKTLFTAAGKFPLDSILEIKSTELTGIFG